ncbi:amidase [Nocardia camponoti]|uniref:amidase n=1 Tax=Nocardia camponoti TaxID=1616106 RepID=A0A917QB99_9NOCA|nr:amidase [Nocardia camponoti]GGK42048.1 amidase [Nocardia camponoti]
MNSVLAQLNSGLDDATSIAASVQDGTRTATEVLANAHDLGDKHNALVTENWARAEQDAAEIDRRRAAGERLGPLAGVPMTVKDVIAVAGIKATAASRAFADNIAAVTAPVVARLIAADAIVIGKTNCPEFAFGTTCSSPLLGTTGNPRYPDRSPGGSSGGEAAALAAGVSALGIGTDFGGSLRWPAQCVGITSLRPTAGRLAQQGQLPGAAGDMTGASAPTGMQGWVQTIGPLARSVRDLALVFEILAGPAPARGTTPLRIAWSDGSALGPVRKEVTALLTDLAARLASNGHQVTEHRVLFADCLPAYNRLRDVDPMRDHLAAIAGREHLITAQNRATIENSVRATTFELYEAEAVARTIQRQALGIFANHDIVLLPVAGGPACDPDGQLDIDGTLSGGWELMAQCRAVSLTGAPVVSLPVGLSSEGWPLSVQIIAAPQQDWLALAFAAELEQCTG